MHRLSIPFQWPSDYEPAIIAPESSDEDVWWFAFRGNELLVSNSPPVTVPRARALDPLGLAAQRTLYLGLLGGVGCYCAEAEGDAKAPDGYSWQSLRGLFGALDEPLFALAGRALQLLAWDRTHQYCGACGTPTRARAIERSRECPDCGLLAYPRLAPAVMCLARRGKRELLLARSPRFAQGMYSALAGFVEPGETLEQCVEREVREEVGIRVKNLRYFGSQPWPFPHSLMIAFTAEHAGGEIVIDRAEIEDARWFDVAELPRLPARISLARRLIDAATQGAIAA